MADRASRSIDAQYYLFHDDVTGGLYAERLLRAAERGVKVRLLLDDMGAHRRDDFLLALDHHPNFEIRIFNPFANRKIRALEYLYRFGLVTRRMHNKSMVVDVVEDGISGMIISMRATSRTSLIWTSWYSGPLSMR